MAATIVFIAATITDAVDGKMARDRHQVTNFGKFLDPLADKILVVTALACLMYERKLHVVVFLLILAREFMVSALRLVVANTGTVVPAGFMGKLKTAFTMVALVAGLLYWAFVIDIDPSKSMLAGSFYSVTEVVLQILFWLAAALTVWSGVEYLVHYWSHINPNQ